MSSHTTEFQSGSGDPRDPRARSLKRRRSRHRFDNKTLPLQNDSSSIPSAPGISSEVVPVSASIGGSSPLSGRDEVEWGGSSLIISGATQTTASTHSESAGVPSERAVEAEDYEREGGPSLNVSSTKRLHWRVIWGLILTNGTMKMTKDQYQSARVIADTFGRLSSAEYQDDNAVVSLQRRRINCLPHYSTLFKTYRPIVFESLAVRSVLWTSEINARSAGARSTQYTEQGTPIVPVSTVLPSEYAREDVACGPVFELMRSASLKYNRDASSTIKAARCIDTWPFIRSREWFYGPVTSISVDEALSTDRALFAEPGDIIQISVLGSTVHGRARAFRPEPESSELSGKIVHIWSVHNECRREDNNFETPLMSLLSDFDKAFVKEFSYVSYKSPSDDVDVPIPEIPEEEMGDQPDEHNTSPMEQTRKISRATAEASRRRKAALQERKRRMEQAWRGWKKPLFKPGDIVALLEPINHCADDGTGDDARSASWKRLCLVYRFWVENEERGRHVILPSQGGIACSDPACINPQQFSEVDDDVYRDVRKVRLLSTGSSSRGPYKTEPISSFGTLDSGETYFIYRFFLFWDGFEVASGNSASGDGFYLIPLNLPPEARSTSNAVRVISLTPPGVKVQAVFKVIIEDIIQGMTSGVVDYDSEGNKIRIFLDLVAFIGDTPAINAVLDVLGHTATACCHLCRVVRRSETLMGSRYARQGFHSLSSHVSRGFFQHTALRDCDAKPDTLRLLGITPTDTETYYPLHEFYRRMTAVKHSIPTTQNGRKILCGFLDPYRSCLVAPDHLLTGHFRDCINFAFRILPTPRHRTTIERFLIGLLQDGNLPVQNRLYDHDKRVLYSMTMTELYALSVVAELGFVKGYEFANQSLRSTIDIPAKIYEAICLLSSCSQLIADLWYVPDLRRDAYSDCVDFYSDNGLARIHYVQNKTQIHIDKVRKICHMDDAKLELLENPRTSRQQKINLGKELRFCNNAIKSLDKPNLHRLQELVYCTIPMVGSVLRIGELQLEKKHQLLKRAIRQSNNKNAHVQSVQSAIFGDWQGRLSLQVSGALKGDLKAEHGCYRLLSGRDEIQRLQGCVTSICRDQVRLMLGPDCCVPQLLDSQAKSVISKRHDPEFSITWTLDHKKEVVTFESTEISTPIRAIVFKQFKKVCELIGSSPKIEFGDYVQCTSNGYPVLTVRCGDVIQVQFTAFRDFRSHFPIVSQAKNPTRTGLPSCNSVPLLWGVSALFRWTTGSGFDEYWASVRLCRVLCEVPAKSDALYASKKYLMDNTLSLLRLHDRIRPTAIFRNCCPEKCALSPPQHSISHAYACDPFKGGSFFIKTRADGFPPRQG